MALQRPSSPRFGGPHRSVVRRAPTQNGQACDFASFAVVVRLMAKAVHLSMEGLSQIAAIAETMNRRKPSRLVESSEAIRQPSHTDCEMKIWS